MWWNFELLSFVHRFPIFGSATGAQLRNAHDRLAEQVRFLAACLLLRLQCPAEVARLQWAGFLAGPELVIALFHAELAC